MRVDPFLAPIEPLPKDRAQAPMSEVVDQAVFFGQRNEPRGFHRSKLGIVPADQRFDPGEAPFADAHLGLIDHVEALLLERPAESGQQSGIRLPAHITRLARSWLRTCSSASSRTGFSTGPAMLRPSASPRRKADSSTRRSNPLTMRTGER